MAARDFARTRVVFESVCACARARSRVCLRVRRWPTGNKVFPLGIVGYKLEKYIKFAKCWHVFFPRVT